MRSMKRMAMVGALGLFACAHGGNNVQPAAAAAPDPNAPHVVKGSEDFKLQMTTHQADGMYRPELRVALEVKNTGTLPVWIRVEKDGYTLGQAPVLNGVATLADTEILLEGALGDGWYKVIVEEIVNNQRYPLAWYTLPISTLDSTGGRMLTIHPSYWRKHTFLRDGSLRFVTSAPLEQPYTQVVTEWAYQGRLVGEVARRWEMPSLWILQPLLFPVRVQVRALYQLEDGQWDVYVFRDGNYEMHCPFAIAAGQVPGRLDCKSDETPLLAAARAKAQQQEAVAPDPDRAQQVRALARSADVRRALVKEELHDKYRELVKKYGAVQASTPSQP
jgi:hypothetical protein